MQQGTDLFGPHVCLGRHLVKGQLERFMLPRLSLGSCLVLQFHIGPELHLLHVALLLGQFCELGAACQMVLEPLLLLFCLFPQLQYFLFGVRFRVDMFGEGLHCAFMRCHLLL